MQGQNSKIKGAALGLLTILSISLHPLQAGTFNVSAGFADIIAPLLPGVVNISTESEITREQLGEIPNLPENHPLYEFFKKFFEEQYSKHPRKATALGSGFLIDAEGHIVTNNHVIADADEITVTFYDKTELKAKVIGRDPRSDLALLKVEAKKPLPFLQWGDSRKARVGDWLIAIGNPFGLGSTVTTGIVSTIARDIQTQGRNGGPSADIIDGYIQTDASINVGNSGGPMINIEGKVIGINTAILSPSGTNIGIGFAIPSDVAMRVIDQLKEYGRTRRGWLGVRVQFVTDEIADALGIGKPRGALVGSVSKDGPAEKSGILPRDVILSFNNVEITDSRHLPRIVGDTPIGATAPVVVWREGKEVKLNVKLGEFEEAEDAGLIPSQRVSEESKRNSKDILGMSLREITPQDRAALKLSDTDTGVLIIDVDPFSEAHEKGLKKGDIIVDIGGKAVNSTQEVSDQVEAAKKKKKKYEIFQFRRDENVLFLALKVEKDPAQERKSEEGSNEDKAKKDKDDKTKKTDK